MVSEGEYKKAKKIVDEYELMLDAEFKKKLALIEKELKQFFATNKVCGKTIKEFRLNNFMGQKDVVEIYPDCFDEDYDDDATDKKLMELGNKHDVWLHFTSSVYPK